MVSEKMAKMGQKSSVIRELFEYGNKRKAEIGVDKVYDFSLGNPAVAPPKKVTDTLIKLLSECDPVSLHGYTSAPGDMSVRDAIANSITEKHSFEAFKENIYITCGAAASLTVSLKALINEGDEIIILAPYFPEYKVFIDNANGKAVEVKCRENDLQIDINALEKAINENTKAIIVNSPNNPSGVIFTEESISSLADLLNKKQIEYSNEIFIISDEPYRELVYTDSEVPYIPKYYDNTLVCYSYSKSLSLPGERIGYIFASPKITNKNIFAAIAASGRSLGFVCAPSLFQKLIANCLDEKSDIEFYRHNRDLLYNKLSEIGYDIIKPDGAFYLFVKALEDDAVKFAETAKKYELLLVPSDDFGVTGYVRIAYCVAEKVILNSFDAFEKLYKEYRG